MDSNNINRPDNTNTPDHSPYGNPADIQGRQPMQNSDMPSQGSMPYGTPDGQQNQGNVPYGYSNNLSNQNSYGNPNGSQNQNTNPYGNPNGSPNQNTDPYGNPSGSPNQNTNPYGSPNGWQNQSNNSYGNPNGSQNQNNNPYRSPNGWQNQSNNPYGAPNSPQNQNLNSYGMPNNAQNQNVNPYGSPNGTPYNNYQPVQKSPADGLITATLALGIATIVSAILGTVYFPFILGGICIVLALLSKGYDEKMSSKPKIGIICSVVGLVLNVLVVSTSVYKVFTDEQTFNQFDRIYEQMYGESFRDMYKDATGQDFPFNFDD